MTRIFATLAVLASAAVVGWLALTVLAPRWRWAADAKAQIAESIGGRSSRYAAVVALVATAGSLYYSEIAHFEPCRLCWYQRIAMYPLVVIFAVAAWGGDEAAGRRYGTALAVPGLLLAGYHYLLQRYPGLDVGTCDVGVPCSAAYVWQWDFVSIAYMALSAFALILVVVWAAPSPATDERHPDREEQPA